MVMEIINPNACIRGCCWSESIPLHLHPSSYSLSSQIARGAESVVYEGILDGKRVAVKKPILSTSQDIDKFHKELQLLCKLDHPGITKLVAADAKPPNYMYFFDFFESGSLAEKLHVEEWTPSIDRVLKISVHLAKALLYLHQLGIVHRDVKPANVLLDSNLDPYLSDFGLAEYKKDLKETSLQNWRSSGKPTGGFHKKNMVGTLIYMAPEILKKEIQTEKSDVYSFGILINELLTGVVPYTDLRAEAQAHTVLEMNYTESQLTAAIVSQGLRPVLARTESGVRMNLISLIQNCWDQNPQNRPSFDHILLQLEPMLTNSQNDNNAPEEDKNDTTVNPRYYQPSINWFTLGDNLSKSVKIILPELGEGIWGEYMNNDSFKYEPVLSWGSYATCGRRESMEDTHFVMPRFFDDDNIHLLGIFDGHRGAAAAEYSARALPIFMQTCGPSISPSNALLESFVKTDVAFRDELESCRKSKGIIQKDSHPGCTAIAALLVKNKLFVANAGDCRTILCRSGQSYALSRDHVGSCVEERERIISAGGSVKWQLDTWRVGPAALQVTRSIGDDDLKPAVTAEPEITETLLSSEDEYIVMASDGLWDVMKNEEVINIIKDTVKEPGMCSKRLATEAAQRGSKDNITVIHVFLRPVSTAERIY